MRNLAIITSVLLLAACGGDEHQDLKEELKTITKDLRGHIDPLPVVNPYEPVPYKAFDLPDPFGPAKIALAIGAATKSKGGANAPDATRPKEPLEAYPLESLKFVGTLSQKGVNYALVRADSSVYRVKAGNYLGQNFGIITGITDNLINLKELVQDASGDWTERKTALQILEVEAAKGR
ncbi:MAG: pilus assembly protein PilP [Betaproteobacteria bacterium]|nr:MAG: pilus assembly protein PilP [Betaproteobacteria bacterium]